jgi:hypothetical protein
MLILLAEELAGNLAGGRLKTAEKPIGKLLAERLLLLLQTEDW